MFEVISGTALFCARKNCLDRKQEQDIEDFFGGPVAQLAELPAHNRLVPGSTPGGSTSKSTKVVRSLYPDFRIQGPFLCPKDARYRLHCLQQDNKKDAEHMLRLWESSGSFQTRWFCPGISPSRFREPQRLPFCAF